MNKIALCFVTLFFSYPLLSSSIKGSVTDASSGEVIVGAVISIPQLTTGTISGLDGSYILNNLQPGTYTLIVQFLGYKEMNQSFTLHDDDNIRVDVSLSQADVYLDAVTVKADATKNTEASARQSEKNSVNIINVISAQAIRISPDLEVSNVVQRISGITLESSGSGDAKYTLMRGMDKRYNSTLINGIKIPSTNNKHRYISLDIFPSDMVERIEVKKALTPDMEGDAVAGVVNLVMKEAPQQLMVEANVGVGYNFFFSDHDFLTFDTKVLHDQSPYEIHGSGYYASPNEFPKENLVIKSGSAPLDNVAGLTIGNRFFHDKLGAIISGSYLNLHAGYNRLDFESDIEKNDVSTLNLPTLSSMQQTAYFNENENAGLHARLDFHFNSANKLKLYSAYINSQTTQLRESDDTNLQVSYDPENGNINGTHSTRFRYNTQKLATIMLQGDHGINKRWSGDWSLVYSKATNLTPDEASVSYYNNLKGFEPFNLFVDFDGSKRLWRHHSDQDKSAYLNLVYQLNFEKAKSAYLKFGGLYRNKSRISFYNSYVLQAIVPVQTPDTSYTSFYAEKNKDWFTYPDINWRVYNPRGTIATGENFESHENVIAGYAMFDLDFNQYQLAGGVRIENTDQGYFMEYPIGQPRPDGKQVFTDILPSLHIKFRPSTNQNLRLSYYRATNKAGFLEIVPCPVIDENDNKSKGNPDLDRAVADNLDLRWEFFPKPQDQLMVGVFYKNILDPIEYAYVKDGSSQDVYYSPVNSGRAVNAGVEIDFIKYFRVFGFKANYTYTASHVNTTKLLYERDENGDLVPNFDVDQERPLQGQSKHAGNLSLLYVGAKNNINAQLAFSYTGDRIYTVSRYYENDYWQKGFWQLDASVNKTFQNGISIYGKANNLLTTEFNGYIQQTNAYNNQFPEHSSADENTSIRNSYSAPSMILGIRFNL